MTVIVVFIFCIFNAGISIASTHWISPDGSSSWGSCVGNSDPGSNYCSLDTANLSVSAGDTIYLKGGVYTLSGGNNYDSGVSPYSTGTDVNKIIYSAAPSETPIIDSSGFAINGIYLNAKNYIVIDGIYFRNVSAFGVLLNSSYNEIKNCTFGPDTGVSGGMLTFNNGSSHNWVLS